MKERLKDLYLEYVNEWLTMDKIAEHYNIPLVTMSVLIELGKEFYTEEHDL